MKFITPSEGSGGDSLVKMKKIDGTIEDFVESKIVAGEKRAGATA